MTHKNEKTGISRRNFIGSTALMGIGSLAAAPLMAAATAVKERGSLLKTLPYLQALQPQSLVLRWLTSMPCFSWVEFGTDHGNLDQKKQRVQQGLVEANNHIHAISLDGLSPDKTYYYRVCSKAINMIDPYKIKYGEAFYSEVYSFTTPAAKPSAVSFLVFNDIHDQPASFGQLLKFAGDEKRDFVFLNGDMFDYQIDENQLVEHLFNPLAPLTALGTPFIFSRGNHETRGEFAREIGQYFNGYGNQYYFSFQYGPVYFIVMDSGEDKEDTHVSYAGLSEFDAYRIEQAKWLKAETQKKAFKKAKYKVVFSHIPLYHSHSQWNYGSEHCRTVWGPILNKAKIDLLVSGHTHVFGIHPPNVEHQYPIVIGGGPSKGNRTLIKVRADEESLELEMLDDSGKRVGHYAVR